MKWEGVIIKFGHYLSFRQAIMEVSNNSIYERNIALSLGVRKQYLDMG